MCSQEELANLWLQGPEDRLCGREQAKAWALREVWLDQGNGEHGMYAFIAARVKKTKNGKPRGQPPTGQSVKEFLEKIDADPDWFPGKHCGEKRGPKRILTSANVANIVSAAKRLKTAGDEPTYAAVVAACPKATLNPKTGLPVDKSTLYAVFRESCYDDKPDDTWDHRNRLRRSALNDVEKQRRWEFAKYMLNLERAARWFFANLVRCDLCNSLLPRTQKKANELALARKGGKGWMSQGSQQSSENLCLPKQVLKLNSSDTVRVWWVPILARGKLHIEFLGDDFPGETPAGAAEMVAWFRAALNIRFQGSAPPKVLFTDRPGKILKFPVGSK